MSLLAKRVSFIIRSNTDKPGPAAVRSAAGAILAASVRPDPVPPGVILAAGAIMPWSDLGGRSDPGSRHDQTDQIQKA